MRESEVSLRLDSGDFWAIVKTEWTPCGWRWLGWLLALAGYPGIHRGSVKLSKSAGSLSLNLVEVTAKQQGVAPPPQVTEKTAREFDLIAQPGSFWGKWKYHRRARETARSRLALMETRAMNFLKPLPQ